MPLIILDRDGVINQETGNYVKSPEEWRWIKGSLEAIVALKKAGFIVAVATNQAGISKGLYDLAALSAIHQQMQQDLREHQVSIDKIRFCPHEDQAKCQCRKPQPGMLQQLADDFAEPINQVIFVGDSLRDLQAAITAGAQAMLVKTGKGADTVKQLDTLDVPVPCFENLLQLANQLIKHYATQL